MRITRKNGKWAQVKYIQIGRGDFERITIFKYWGCIIADVVLLQMILKKEWQKSKCYGALPIKQHLWE